MFKKPLDYGETSFEEWRAFVYEELHKAAERARSAGIEAWYEPKRGCVMKTPTLRMITEEERRTAEAAEEANEKRALEEITRWAEDHVPKAPPPGEAQGWDQIRLPKDLEESMADERLNGLVKLTYRALGAAQIRQIARCLLRSRLVDLAPIREAAEPALILLPEGYKEFERQMSASWIELCVSVVTMRLLKANPFLQERAGRTATPPQIDLRVSLQADEPFEDQMCATWLEGCRSRGWLPRSADL